MFATLAERVKTAELTHEQRFLEAVAKGPWNNARLVQYRTYNHKREWFQSVLDQENGDLLGFIRAIGEITKGEKDPFKALENAANEDNTPVE